MRMLTVSKNEAGQRLDKLLAKYLNLAGKSFIYKMMRKKNITLNGKKCDGSEHLTEGDEIKLFLAEETIEKFSEVKIQKVQKKKLDIVYEDEHIVLINKPSGMLSQKAKETDESLVEYLIDYLLDSGKLKKEELASFRPSVCNRLDRLLRVHEGRADVGRNVVDLVRRCREALVLLNHDLQFVADLARILRLCVLAGCLCTAAVQTEQVQRLGIREDLAQRTQLVRRVGIAGQRKRALLELAVLDGHDLVLRSPVEGQRESRRAAVAQGRRRTSRRHKVDVRTGQNLVLYGVHTAA